MKSWRPDNLTPKDHRVLDDIETIDWTLPSDSESIEAAREHNAAVKKLTPCTTPLTVPQAKKGKTKHGT